MIWPLNTLDTPHQVWIENSEFEVNMLSEHLHRYTSVIFDYVKFLLFSVC